eukprot:Skav215446  [mRNA]  locus=scaffold2193:53380:54036:- [translate_table: standard]
MASANGHLEIVRRLLDARASPDLANEAGNCPLHWVACQQRGGHAGYTADLEVII